MLTTAQAAERLGVHPETLRRMIRDGRLKAIHLGNGPKAKIRVDEKELQAFCDNSASVDIGC